MAYSKRPYVPRRYNAKKRMPFRPKRTIYKKKTAPAKTALVAKKALSLAKYNNKLAYGSYQNNFQISRRALKITGNTPACLHMVTPVQGEVVFQFLPDPQAPGVPLTYSAQQATTMIIPTLEQASGGPGTGGDVKHNLWKDANDDNINGKYKLLTTALTITVKTNKQLKHNVRYRVDFVKPRWNRMMSQIFSGANVEPLQSNLPLVLGSFNNLLDYTNRVNPMYFTQCAPSAYFDVKVPRSANGATTGTTEWDPTPMVFQKHIKIKHYEVFNPVDLGTALANQPYNGVSQNKRMWCIISSDHPDVNTADIPGIPEVYISRLVSWRDKIGHSA